MSKFDRSWIRIDGLAVEMSIGVFEWEKSIQQRLVFDLRLACDFGPAQLSDNIEDAVSYAEVSERLIDLCQRKHYDLLEHLAHVISEDLFSTYPIQSIELRIAKPGAVKDAQSVGVEIYRERPDL